VRYHEAERWLRMPRGDHTLVMNFADEPRAVATSARRIVVATHEKTMIDAHGTITLPPLAGALGVHP
jgi:hypothetical protein